MKLKKTKNEMFPYSVGERTQLLVSAANNGFSWEKANEILDGAGYGKLYARNIEDVIWVYILKEKIPQEQWNSLYEKVLTNL